VFWDSRVGIGPTSPNPPLGLNDDEHSHRLDAYGNAVLADGASCELRTNNLPRTLVDEEGPESLAQRLRPLPVSGTCVFPICVSYSS
jgi:hypothetical protein